MTDRRILVLDKTLSKDQIKEYRSYHEFRKAKGLARAGGELLKKLNSGGVANLKNYLIIKGVSVNNKIRLANYNYLQSLQKALKLRSKEHDLLIKKLKEEDKTIVVLNKNKEVEEEFPGSLKEFAVKKKVKYSTLKARLSKAPNILKTKVELYKELYIYKEDYKKFKEL